MQVDEIVNEVVTIVRTLSEQEMGSLSADTLSRLAVKLASYKASLGEHVSEAERAFLGAKAEYKLAKAEEFQRLRDDGKNSTDAGELKTIGAHASNVTYLEAEYAFKRLSRLSSDCHDLIEAIRGRTINLNQERSEANVT